MTRRYLAFVAALLLAAPAMAQTTRGRRAILPQQTGNFCVQDFQAGANCTANDVRFESIEVISNSEPCTGPADTGTFVFRAAISTDGGPDRYDVGIFMALDGGSALSGDNCFHDFLDPPLTTTPTYAADGADANTLRELLDGPWWEGEDAVGSGDECGDIEKDDGGIGDVESKKTLDPVTIACDDEVGADGLPPGDGIVDISVCSSWDNNTNTVCTGVTEAFPGTNSKCGCQRVNIGFAVPVELQKYEVD